MDVILVILGTCVQKFVTTESMALNARKNVDIAVMLASVSIPTVPVSLGVRMVIRGNCVKHIAIRDVTGLAAQKIVETVQT